MPLVLRVLPLLLAGALLAGVPARAQCSDCLAPGGDAVPLFVTKSGTDDGESARAQAGDATAVLVEEQAQPGSGRRLQPGLTLNTPTAFGPGWGHVYAGVSYQDRIRYSDWHDGILAAGAGFGNPARTVGLSATVSLLDTYTEFGKDRSLSLKLHRHLPLRSAVAVGYENIWHTAGTDGGDSHYAVASTILLLRADPTAPFGSVVVSAGLGDDRFLAEEQFARGKMGVNPFGSLALRLLRPVNGLVNWSGQDLNLGLSMVPHPVLPITITPALLDVTGRAGDGARFAVSAGIGYNIRR
jgi:hypothetical protein